MIPFKEIVELFLIESSFASCVPIFVRCDSI